MRTNNTTMTAIDKIVDGFPHPMIPPIIGIPTYEAIANLNLHLNANAASVQSNLGDGQLGLLALTISPAIYNALSAIAFVPPAMTDGLTAGESLGEELGLADGPTVGE
jgi:hypothetical protein